MSDGVDVEEEDVKSLVLCSDVGVGEVASEVDVEEVEEEGESLDWDVCSVVVGEGVGSEVPFVRVGFRGEEDQKREKNICQYRLIGIII